MNASVCLSASISPELLDQSSPISARATHGRDSVLLWRRCDMLCTSGVVCDVIFAHNEPFGAHWSMCSK